MCRLAAAATDGQAAFGGSRDFHGTATQQQQQSVSQPETIEVFVNDDSLHIPKGSTVMQACDAAGIDIPR